MTLFFIKVDNRIVPFDLKITHISDEFFNKYPEGLQEINTNDSYISNNKESEIKNIKRIYKNSKEKYHLPNYGSLSKPELMEILEEQNSPEINQELSSIMSNRREMINEISQDIKPLEWWNHKYQGERLFSNNNRFLVFLVHKNSFKEGKDLKKDIIDIRNSITNKLDNLTIKDLHEIHYIYEKDKKYNGIYKINCISVLIEKE